MKDEIVEEVRKFRFEHAQRFGFNLDAIFEDLLRIQKTCGHPVVSFPPKVPKPVVRQSHRAEGPPD